jgi:hypothetical protein
VAAAVAVAARAEPAQRKNAGKTSRSRTQMARISPSARGDQVLREMASDDANDAIAVLDRVRQIVCAR